MNVLCAAYHLAQTELQHCEMRITAALACIELHIKA
jgi:hypothetical protein